MQLKKPSTKLQRASMIRSPLGKSNSLLNALVLIKVETGFTRHCI